MSNEEAIKILKEVREEVLAKETELSKQVFENLGIKAIDLAIKALEQQPCEDCISRAQAVKYFEENLIEVFDKHEVADEIQYNLPSVTPSYNSVKTELEQESILDKIRAEIELHRRKTESIDPYDLVGDCLDIIDKYTEGSDSE